MKITKQRLSEIIKEEISSLDSPMHQHQEIPVDDVESAKQEVLLKHLAKTVQEIMGPDVNLYKALVNSAELFARTSVKTTPGEYLGVTSESPSPVVYEEEGDKVMAALEDLPAAAKAIASETFKKIEDLSGDNIEPAALASAVAAILMELN